MCCRETSTALVDGNLLRVLLYGRRISIEEVEGGWTDTICRIERGPGRKGKKEKGGRKGNLVIQDFPLPSLSPNREFALQSVVAVGVPPSAHLFFRPTTFLSSD